MDTIRDSRAIWSLFYLDAAENTRLSLLQNKDNGNGEVDANCS